MKNKHVTADDIETAMLKSMKQGGKWEPPIISYKTHYMLKEILKIDPDFRFTTEAEIWYKAHQLSIK